MAEQQNGWSGTGVDPVTGFWRDMWARMTAAQGGTSAAPEAAAAAMPFMTPEAMRRMQAAFYESMAQYAEQYMRSPEFLSAMKRSMDQALQFRQQMDDFLKSNMAAAFETASGGTNSEILGAIRQMSAQLQAQVARIDERVRDLESRNDGPRPASKPDSKANAGRSQAKPTGTRKSSRKSSRK